VVLALAAGFAITMAFRGAPDPPKDERIVPMGVVAAFQVSKWLAGWGHRLAWEMFFSALACYSALLCAACVVCFQGLRRRSDRVNVLCASTLHVIPVPIGTLLGLTTILAVTSASSSKLFRRP
jgi:hypothetical protein